MSIKITYGASRNELSASGLVEALKRTHDFGTLYLGYPILRNAKETIKVDGLWVSESCGVIAFLLPERVPNEKHEWDEARSAQDALFNALTSLFLGHESLTRGRNLNVALRVISVLPTLRDFSDNSDETYTFVSIDDLQSVLNESSHLGESTERAVNAAIQRVSNIKPKKKRSDVKNSSSRGSKIKRIESNIANLDEWQRGAAIETANAPQRIRGLAGSGKTIVLAIKAAYLHSEYPDWNIVVTFHSRALYQQFQDLIDRFTLEQKNERFNPDRLKILHAWGGRGRSGLYREIAESVGETPLDFSSAQREFGDADPFEGACRKLLEQVRAREHSELFDAVLIDEAQDLPPSFFQLVHKFTKDPKRIVLAYDELQKISDAEMDTTEEMFGVDERGNPVVEFPRVENGPQRDVVLPVCYRNTPWALTTAHAIGFGTYREPEIVQDFKDPSTWIDIGYECSGGNLAKGSRVSLQRARGSYPSYFVDEIEPQDAVSVHKFNTTVEQDAWVAEQIKINITEDELDPDDVLVVLPSAYSARSRSAALFHSLSKSGIKSHLVGVTSSTDLVFEKDSIALAHVHRAKGNEAPMVYVVDSQRAASSTNVILNRNTLFTAITRSKAWVRICGVGSGMEIVENEINRVIANQFRLDFEIPTELELEQLRNKYRPIPAALESAILRGSPRLKEFFESFEKLGGRPSDLPDEITEMMRVFLKRQEDDADA